MKTIHFILFIFLIGLTSCYQDKGNYAYSEIPDISVDGIESSYFKTSYIGDKLEITPTVNTTYSSMDYEWYIWENQDKKAISTSDSMIQIGKEKNLSYEIKMAPGIYKLMFKAISKDNGYATSKVFNLEVTTKFSRGFYILKENTDGKSDLDLFYKDGAPIVSDIFTVTGSGAISGQPLLVGPMYNHGYIDKNANEVKTCNALFVTTKDKKVIFYNSGDMSKLQDNNNIAYGGLASEEQPYGAYSSPYYNYFLTSKGLYSVVSVYASSAFTHDFGDGGSAFMPYFEITIWGMKMGANMFWNNEQHCIDYFGMAKSYKGAFKENGFSTKNMECLYAGSSLSTSRVYFILKDAQGDKYLYEVDAAKLKTIGYTKLDKSSKFANASNFAINEKTANYLYYIYDNQLYAYNLSTKEDAVSPFSLAGISADEKITYLSYQWLDCTADEASGYNFVYLVVGTQNGDNYKIRMYDIVGGEPHNLVRTIEGKGKLKMVSYISPRFDTTKDTYSVPN